MGRFYKLGFQPCLLVCKVRVLLDEGGVSEGKVTVFGDELVKCLLIAVDYANEALVLFPQRLNVFSQFTHLLTVDLVFLISCSFYSLL